MPKVVGVRFRTSPRMYYFAPTEGEEYPKDTAVVVETQRGVELATVIAPEHEVDDDKIVAPLKPILRIATEADIEAVKTDDAQKRDILATAKEKVAARGLDMKVVDCEFTVDRGKLVLYFTAEQRVDFRELVRDLASAFHTRIDLRQIGPRDECKLIGTLGACGMQCCCGRFESDSEHVSIKMAKNQNLALTPNKINGMCGRLLCCLAYENKTYEDIMKRMPKHGQFVTVKDGRRGSVVSVTPLTEKVRLRVGDDESFEFCEVDLADLEFERRDAKNGGAQDGGSGGNNGNNDGNRNNNRGGNGNNRDGGNGERRNKNKHNNNGKPRRDNAEGKPEAVQNNKAQGGENKGVNKDRDNNGNRNNGGGKKNRNNRNKNGFKQREKKPENVAEKSE